MVGPQIWEEKVDRVEDGHRLELNMKEGVVVITGGSHKGLVILLQLEGMEGVEKTTPKEENSTGTHRRLSCTACFDALGFCYSPVHQMQQYYRLGVFDNCSEKWTALFDCLNLKTKRPSEVQEILESREKNRAHIWTFRTPEEASSHWKELFGDLDEME